MNEVLADVSRSPATADTCAGRALLRSRDPRPAHAARGHTDRQARQHADPQGDRLARIAELGGDPAGADAATFFWERVARHRSVAFGGNSVREHFNPTDDFTSMLESREGPETCNTYNMLRLTEQLFAPSRQARYADYYERALFNHILSHAASAITAASSISRRSGRVTTASIRSRAVLLVLRRHRHGEPRQVWRIRLRARRRRRRSSICSSPPSCDWAERGLTLRQETTFPDDARRRACARRWASRAGSRCASVIPAGSRPAASRMRVNGQPWPVSSAPSSYAAIERDWRDGDRVDVDLPMRTTIEALPGIGLRRRAARPDRARRADRHRRSSRARRRRRPHGARLARPLPAADRGADAGRRSDAARRRHHAGGGTRR